LEEEIIFQLDEWQGNNSSITGKKAQFPVKEKRKKKFSNCFSKSFSGRIMEYGRNVSHTRNCSFHSSNWFVMPRWKN